MITDRDIFNAKLAFAKLKVIAGPVDYYNENIGFLAEDIAEERRRVLESDEVKGLLGIAKHGIEQCHFCGLGGKEGHHPKCVVPIIISAFQRMLKMDGIQ